MKALSVTTPQDAKKKLSMQLAFITLLLSLFGLLMIYSASSYNADYHFGDSFYYVKKQAIALFVGIIAMVAFSKLKPEIIRKFRYIILGVSIVLLAVIFIPGVGMQSYGARRWINLGFMTIQPSEIAKFGYVIYSAAYIADNGVDTFKRMLPVLLVGIIMCVLIMLEPNMSITMCMGCIMLCMLFLGGLKLKHFLVVLIPILIAVPLLIVVEPYRFKRILAFIDPWAAPKAEGYQLIQSYYALGSGGWFGLGLFNSRQKYLFLPFSESDFIFSVIGEELGLVGAIGVMIVFFYLVYLGLKTAAQADTRFKALLAFGISAVIAVQTLLNLAVVTGCIPPTGLPLPFISAAGSSLVCFMGAIGILISINNSKGDNLPIAYHSM